MINRRCPLRYRISSWRQLVDCKSNNSRDLKIHISDYFNNTKLRGFRISVDHPEFGTLFACILDARGDLVSSDADYGETELSNDTILAELRKYGFYITYDASFHLGSAQLEYLLTLKNLGFDKLRIIAFTSSDDDRTWMPQIVAFQVNPLGDWLNNAYVPSESEFNRALMDGTAVNLTNISDTKKFRWDWLKGYVADIDDIIRVNSDNMIYIPEPSPEPDSDDSLDPSVVYDPDTTDDSDLDDIFYSDDD